MPKWKFEKLENFENVQLYVVYNICHLKSGANVRKDVLEFRIRKTINQNWNLPSEPDQFDLFRPVEPPSKSNRFK